MKKNPNPINIPQRTQKSAQGFTLVELLVVITIIAVLAALTMTITGKIRTRAYEAKALSTLRQIALATSSFSAENNGNIHYMRGETDPLQKGDQYKKSFWGILQPYLAPDIPGGNDQSIKNQLVSRLQLIFGTKDLKTMEGTFLRGSQIGGDKAAPILPTPLAFNRKVVEFNGYKKVQSFSDPSQVVYFTYGSWWFDKKDGSTFKKLPNKNPGATTKIYWFDNATAPMVFVDGHIEMVGVPIADRRYE